MFKIYDGRTCFWQWDVDCKLVFEDSSITKVHFCNRTDDCSLVCDVYEENGQYLVNVPNILLQDNWDIHVYAYDSTHTKHEDVFKVRPRSKPADYVYTETEIATWESLEKRMDEIEATVTTEGVAQAVEDYLAENPIEAGATAEEAAQIEANKNAINEIQNAGYLTSVPDEYVTEIELNDKTFATEKYVDDAIANASTGNVDLSDYAKKEDIPDVSDFITEVPSEYVTDSELNAKGYLTEHQSLDNYPTWGDMGSAMSDKVTTEQLNESIADFVTEIDMNIAIQNAINSIVDGEEVSY